MGGATTTTKVTTITMNPKHDLPGPRIKLHQGTVVGVVQEICPGKRVEAFRGIPYALPPVGNLRFKAPVKVPASSGIIDATRFGPAAPCKPLIVTGPRLEYSEDCLTVNVFRQIPESKATLLPVFIYIHGGAFNRGTASMHNTASMVAWSEAPFIAVSFNYRLGSLGFLPSTLSAQEGALNLGLRDQNCLFEWVQDNIEAFGGDKNNVTLGGLSAGAHSIGHHLMRHNERNPGPFHRVIIESGAPTSRAVRKFDSKLHEQQFREFLYAVGCPDDIPDSDVFYFLRSIPLERIIEAQNTVFDRYNRSLNWAFQPVIDGDLIPRAPIDAWRSNDYYKVPILTGFTGNEGSLYVEKQMSCGKEFREFFQTLLPQLSEEDINNIEHLYPDPETSPDKTYSVDGDIPGVGKQYKRVEAAYGQYAYIAPVRQTAQLASTRQSAPVYLYHWAAKSSVIGGAQHGDNMRYETCDAEIISRSTSQRALAGTFHAYVTSFICHGGDPSAIGGELKDRPEWKPFREDDPEAMIFGKGNEELIGGSVGTTAELQRDDWAREQCNFWWDIVELTQQ